MNGIVIEIKSIEQQKAKEEDTKFHTRVNIEIEAALDQIERNKYYMELIENKIRPENIIKLPIVFAGKSVFINKLKMD